jgi:hypothetical protein
MSDDALDEHPGGRLEGLITAWANREDRFDDWVREVSRAYFSSRLRLEGASKLLGTTPAELQAVLMLATLDDADLAKLASAPPPKTTWLSLAGAKTLGIEAALEALQHLPSGESPFHAVEDAITRVEGPTALYRVGQLPGATLARMASKAKQYGLLRPQDRQALVSFGIMKQTGKPLSPRQMAYAFNLLTKLLDGGAIKRDSPDADQADCDAVLDALSVE